MLEMLPHLKRKVNVPTTKCAMKLQLSPLTQNIHWGNIQENINYGNQNVFQEEGQKILVLVNVAMATKLKMKLTTWKYELS